MNLHTSIIDGDLEHAGVQFRPSEKIDPSLADGAAKPNPTPKK